jgi:hypothetical protein
MMLDKSPGKAERVTQALMQMTKLDIGVLKKAYERD